MAKKALINREAKRTKMVEKYAAQRKQLKATIDSSVASDEDKATARLKLLAMPRNANPSRMRNRCAVTGRPRGVFRKFGLCRNMLREIAMRGEVPGLIKASW